MTSLPARRGEWLLATAGAEPQPAALAHALLVLILIGLLAFGLWARWAMLDEVTWAEGKVIPSRQIQVVQNLEGGIIAAILVREGETVAAGQVLMRIDNLRAASDFREKRARWLALSAAAARLRAEIEDGAPEFPAELLAEAPDLVANELALFRRRAAQLESELELLRRQEEQRQQELAELESRLGQLGRSHRLAAEELELMRSVGAGVPKGDRLRLARQVNDLAGELEQSRLAVPRARTALREAGQRIANAFSTFRAEAQRELNAHEAELTGLGELMRAGADRVRRTEVRAPVRGTVKTLHVATIGGVVQPGADLAELVPLEDTLLVEARVRPADIAFISPGQPATVRLTAYDFTVYGGLAGVVEEISADTIENGRGESFYRVRVRTERSHLGHAEAPMRIIPGMTATVSIQTGRKSVLDYLLRPLVKARHEALTER